MPLDLSVWLGLPWLGLCPVSLPLKWLCMEGLPGRVFDKETEAMARIQL